MRENLRQIYKAMALHFEKLASNMGSEPVGLRRLNLEYMLNEAYGSREPDQDLVRVLEQKQKLLSPEQLKKFHQRVCFDEDVMMAVFNITYSEECPAENLRILTDAMNKNRLEFLQNHGVLKKTKKTEKTTSY